MSLIKFGEFLKPQDHLKNVYKGKVVYNNDPLKLQRIKVIIPEFLEGINIDKNKKRADQEILDCLPWITPFEHYTAFGRAIVVPEINDYVKVTFPYNDAHLGFYDNSYFIHENNALAKTHAPVFNVDYPKTVGYEDSTGTYLAINKEQKYMDFKHNSGFRIQINQNGKCEITVPDNLEIEVNKQTDHHSVEKIMLYSDDKIELNKPAILPSARKTDATKHFCPVIMAIVDGWIDKGNDKVIENI